MMPADRLVFIVDDDEAVRDSLQLLLESAGHAVQAFEAAADALASCRTRAPACIVTDVRMPEMDGLECLDSMTSRFEQQLQRIAHCLIIIDNKDQPIWLRHRDHPDLPKGP